MQKSYVIHSLIVLGILSFLSTFGAWLSADRVLSGYSYAGIRSMLFPEKLGNTSASGPTAYPHDVKDWPGVGVIRFFSWMPIYREAFWRERRLNKGAVVFAGDSLIQGWTTLDRDFPSLRVANRGIGGDVSRGLLFRFTEDVIDLNPQAVVLLIGTNDLTAQADPATVISNINSMLSDHLRAHDNSPPVILCTLLPSADPKAPTSEEKRLLLNRMIVGLSENLRGVFILDLYKLFTRGDGSIDYKFFGNDHFHLSFAGYEKWHDALVPIFHTLRIM